jgi:hypothetical protein
LFSLITGFENDMLLIVFVGLIASLTPISGYCIAEDMTVTNFNCSQVAISGLT